MEWTILHLYPELMSLYGEYANLALLTHLLTAQGAEVTVERVDTEVFTAWKDGIFYFKDMPLEEILRTLARWYDVEVFVATPSLRNLRFTATFSRYEPLNDILDALALTTHIAFDLNGRSLIVRKE